MLLVILLMGATSAQAARKPCDELRQEIAAKIDARGVKSYTLEVVALDVASDGKVVGTCDGGTQRIVYLRGPADVAAPVAKLD